MYEIDFLQVGDGEKSGDAIALRYDHQPNWQNNGQVVIVIDGGFRDDGEALVEHIPRYYGTDRVDLVVSTHPDADHINGLSVVLEHLEVGEVLMHKPWEHTQDIANLFHDGRITDTSIGEKLRGSLEQACALEQQASQLGIEVNEPFAGLSRFDGTYTVAGPSLEYYEDRIAYFRGLPLLAAVQAALAKRAALAMSAVRTLVRETLDPSTETLDDIGVTAAENETSVISELFVDGKRVILTGDAGIESLEHAANWMEFFGHGYQQPYLFQVPHHGSRRNIGPTILDRIIGEPGSGRTCKALVSASSAAPKHPSSRVVNALIRRGAIVSSTESCSLLFSEGSRPGWGAVPPLTFTLDLGDDD